MRSVVLAFSLLLLSGAGWAGTYSLPDPQLTPGTLCSENDPNFDKLDYPEQIARCKRNVSEDEKAQIAHDYGDIPKSNWHNYEFDHLIPLCAGGSDDIRNVWPQPIGEAHDKDKLEDEVCSGMRDGTLSQAEAIAKVHAWFDGRAAR